MAGTDNKKKLIEEGPVVILAEPQLGENIGMVARAMANFGLAELRLVNPRDGWPSDKARRAASNADHVIDAVKVFDRIEDAIADLHFTYATTARHRDMLKPVRSPREAVSTLLTKFKSGERTGILFGRERWGLNNEEIALSDEIVTFPVNPAFASLNIAQAVLLMSYEWMNATMAEPEKPVFGAIDSETASKEDMVGLFEHLESALDDARYFYPPAKRERMRLNLRNTFTHAKLKTPEIHALRGAIAALERRWKKKRGEW
ncbi:MAG: RNA methyltransferase [Rhizobiaceae bacterium]|nr:RNA methyltransferase [Rhizobiaceae bacterium]